MYGYFIVFFIGFGFLAYGVYILQSHVQAKTWPTVAGTLTQLSYEDEYDSAEYRNQYLVAKPQYHYLVNGVKYQGSTFCLDEKSGWIEEKKIRKTSNFFCNVGDTLKVHYHPKNPAKSVLQIALSEKRKSHYLAICASGILLIAISITLAIYIQ
jgi:Protein of unknown function (DUF3592)